MVAARLAGSVRRSSSGEIRGLRPPASVSVSAPQVTPLRSLRNASEEVSVRTDGWSKKMGFVAKVVNLLLSQAPRKGCCVSTRFRRILVGREAIKQRQPMAFGGTPGRVFVQPVIPSFQNDAMNRRVRLTDEGRSAHHVAIPTRRPL